MASAEDVFEVRQLLEEATPAVIPAATEHVRGLSPPALPQARPVAQLVVRRLARPAAPPTPRTLASRSFLPPAVTAATSAESHLLEHMLTSAQAAAPSDAATAATSATSTCSIIC
jgi:hypothetical protein